VFRYQSRKNPDINGFWICDYGRYSYSYVDDGRLDKIINNSQENNLKWESAIPYIAKKMRRLRDMGETSHIALILNTWLTNEELFLINKLFIESYNVKKLYFADPPKGKADDILLTLERTPNRRGAQEIGFELNPLDWNTLSENTDLLLVFGSFLTEQTKAEEFKTHLANIKTKILLTPHSSDLDSLMDVVLPTSVIPEKSGSLTNMDGIVQEFSPVLESLGKSRPEWEILVELARLANADFNVEAFTTPAAILEEMGNEIDFFKKKQ
jgi:predicted molibdopterin-dependent oxidoreductase YjgC